MISAACCVAPSRLDRLDGILGPNSPSKLMRRLLMKKTNPETALTNQMRADAPARGPPNTKGESLKAERESKLDKETTLDSPLATDLAREKRSRSRSMTLHRLAGAAMKVVTASDWTREPEIDR